MAGLNVSKFSSHIAKVGLASPNKFEVKFESVPTDAAGKLALENLNLMCETVSIAGRSVQSMLDRQYGINREVAYNGPQYVPITIGFLCSKQLIEKKIFDAWNNKIVDIGNGYDVAYYSKYATGKMTVTMLDNTGEPAGYSIVYNECYPKTVQSIDLNHSNQNATLRMSVEMAYAYWTTEDIKFGERQLNEATSE